MLKFIFKELKNQPGFVFLFVLNLSLGLAGFTALDVFKYSLDTALKNNSKAMLGGDLSLSARRPLTREEKQKVYRLAGSKGGKIETAKTIQLYSMLSSPVPKAASPAVPKAASPTVPKAASRLVQIKAVSDNYPFYGELGFRLQPAELDKNNIRREIHKKPVIWIYPELLDQLNLKIGDKVSVGKADFQIVNVLEEDPSSAVLQRIAPRVYISEKYLSQTGLLTPHSLAWYSYIYKIPGKNIFQLEKISKNIFSEIEDPGVRVYTHTSASESIGKLTDYLNDFLSLTALCALVLAAAGMGFLLHSYLKTKIQAMAVLMTLGLSRWKAFSLYFLQILFLGGLSFFSALILGAVLCLCLYPVFSYIMPFEFYFNAGSFGVSALLAFLTPALISAPLFLLLRNIKVSSLLLNQNIDYKNNFSIKTFQQRFFLPALFKKICSAISKKYIFILSFLIGFFVFWILSVWQSHSFYTGSVFTILFSTAGLLLFGCGWLILAVLSRSRFSSFLLLQVVRSLCRYRVSSLLCFLCLSFGVLLLNLIPQVQYSLVQEIKNPKSSRLPGFFLFDIQENQKEPLKKLLLEKKIQNFNMLPMVRARLLSVNGVKFDKGAGLQKLTRDKEREMRLRNRGFNLSYRNFFYDEEKILKGLKFQTLLSQKTFLTAEGVPLPWISMEQRFAKRLNLKINDVLSFDVQGKTIRALIKNIRKVKWHTFQPNFFVVFPTGVLEKFSKTYLTSLPDFSSNTALKIHNSITRRFSNISIVNVKRTISRLADLSSQISKALVIMSVLCLLLGFVVLYSIVSHQAQSGKKDIALFKALGADSLSIKKIFLYQFGFIAFVSGVLGLTLSLGLSYVLSVVLFHSAWAFSIYLPSAILIGVLLLTCVVALWSVQKAVHTPVKILFNN